MTAILCPRCPVCGSDPEPNLAEIVRPWFCPNEACGCFSWHPEHDLAANLLATVSIHGFECPHAGQPVDARDRATCTCGAW